MDFKYVIILIPPSEGKQVGGRYSPINKLNSITKLILEQINIADSKKLYDLKDKALNDAIKINQEILLSKTLPAIERYSGVVYNGINYSSLSDKDKKLFNKYIRIVSALFGLLKPQDNIPNYKLKIDKLNSANLWLEENSKLLKGKYVIDLLPKAHRKSVSYTSGIEVEFVLLRNGKKMPAGHQGKLIKGKFVRWLIENDIFDTLRFKEYKEDGYIWNGNYFIKEI